MSSDIDEIKQLAGQLNGPPGARPVSKTVLRPFLAQAARYWWVELLACARCRLRRISACYSQELKN